MRANICSRNHEIQTNNFLLLLLFTFSSGCFIGKFKIYQLYSVLWEHFVLRRSVNNSKVRVDDDVHRVHFAGSRLTSSSLLECCGSVRVELLQVKISWGISTETIIFNPRNIQLPYQKCNNFTKCTQNGHKFHNWKSVATTMCTII